MSKRKIAIITGGANGIGLEISKVLLKKKCIVIIIDKEQKKSSIVESLQKKFKNLKYICIDISSKENCKKVIDNIYQDYNSINYLVNNAAPGRNKKYIGKIIDNDWNIHSKVVICATAFLSEYAVRYMKKNKHNAIVNISSIISSEISNLNCSWSYHVSKAGLNQLTKFQAEKYGRSNQIRVNAVAPGLVKRENIHKNNSNKTIENKIKKIVPLKRRAKGKEIGDLVYFLLSKKSSYITGQVITIDGGLCLTENYELATNLNI